MKKYTYLCVFEMFEEDGSSDGTGNTVIVTDKRIKNNSLVREIEYQIGKELEKKYIVLTNIVLLDEGEASE